MEEGIVLPADAVSRYVRCSAIQIFHGVMDSGGSGKMCWLRKVCKSVSGNGYFNSGGGRMKKSWYDYLWIASLMYLVLGFFRFYLRGWDCYAFYSADHCNCEGGTRVSAIVIAEEDSCLS